jgi:hypothetical protein
VSKRAAQKIDTERFNVKKLNEGVVKGQHQVTIRDKFAALENLEDSGNINRAWDNIRENIKISAQESLGYCEPKHRKRWFDEGCSKLVDQRKQAKLQWLQDQSEANEGNLSDIRWKLVDISGTRKGNIWKTKLMSLNKTIRMRTSETCIGA